MARPAEHKDPTVASRPKDSNNGRGLELNWNETVYLRVLHALRPGQRMAAGFLKRTTLRNAVREVMEDWGPMQRSSAAILQGSSIHHHNDIERLYSQVDFLVPIRPRISH
jgi:hypothetical protein